MRRIFVFCVLILGCGDFAITTGGGNGYVADPTAPFCDQTVWDNPGEFGGGAPQPTTVAPCGTFNPNGHAYVLCTYAPVNFNCSQCFPDIYNSCDCSIAYPSAIPDGGCQLYTNPPVICVSVCL